MSEEKYKILSTINTPQDIRRLDEEQLPLLCDELRQFLIEELSQNPGHFASSLCAVEITVALHYVYNTPEDRIVWDVGHQAYGHKILTGRRDVFNTNRKYKGISGFPNPKESEYDAFIAGHASNSISAAFGMAIAHELDNSDQKTVAVIGDGAMSGGLAFEGLNNLSEFPNDMLVVLNDNHMAIDKNVGGISRSLLKISTSRFYNKIRSHIFSTVAGNEQQKRHTLITNTIKAVFSHTPNIFEGLSIRYFGPIDGHNVIDMVHVLQDIKKIKGPKVLHCLTVKGKGYKPAEESATEWHAPGRFNKETGERIVAMKEQDKSLYQDIFGHTLVELAEKNDKIVGVTPAMASGCSMTYLMQKMPERAFDVGIAESHAVTFSAGMAKEGKIPFCNIYSSFMQRAYDQIIHDVAILNLPVVLCLDRAGLVGEDGVTHHGLFDLAYLRCVPNLIISSPMTGTELRNLMYTAQLKNNGAFVIRYSKGWGVSPSWNSPMEEIKIGTGRCISKGKDVAILSIGHIGNDVQKAVQKASEKGISVAHYDMRFLKPIDAQILHEVGRNFSKVITVENGVIKGGLGSEVTEFMSDNDYKPIIRKIGIPDEFIEHGSREELHRQCGMDEDSIFEKIVEISKLK